MRLNPLEFDVYLRLTDFLNAAGWSIICASPPGGTDTRYRRCLLPRRDLASRQREPRDEVDLTAQKNNCLLLIECKPRLSDSLLLLNRLKESDYRKLQRIVALFPAPQLAQLLQQATGIITPANPTVALALAVEVVDYAVPQDMTVIELSSTITRVWTAAPLTAEYLSQP